MFFMKMRVLRIILIIFDVSKYSTQSIPTKKLSAPLLADHYPKDGNDKILYRKMMLTASNVNSMF